MTLAQFRNRFPEFNLATDPLVNSCLAQALARVNASVWGSAFDEGHGLLTAHLLALAPNGQMARLEIGTQQESTPSTTYALQFRVLERQRTVCTARLI